MNTPSKSGELAGRVLLSSLFLVSGLSKLGAYAGTQAYMASASVPGALLPLVLLTEIGGGLAILLGLQTRIVAILLAGFSIVTALLFHTGHDPIQQIMLLKNFTIAGGLLLLTVHGAGPLSLDGRRAAQA